MYLLLRRSIFVGLIAFFSFNLFAQDLLQERIRKIDNRKRSVYIDQGIIHNGGENRTSTVKAIRQSYSSDRGYERLVFDFTTDELPRIYGHISKSDRRLYLDFFRTSISDGIDSFGNSQYVDSINFFPIEQGDVSVEVVFKRNVNVEVFYLDGPGRLVVDIKP